MCFLVWLEQVPPCSLQLNYLRVDCALFPCWLWRDGLSFRKTRSGGPDDRGRDWRRMSSVSTSTTLSGFKELLSKMPEGVKIHTKGWDFKEDTWDSQPEYFPVERRKSSKSMSACHLVERIPLARDNNFYFRHQLQCPVCSIWLLPPIYQCEVWWNIMNNAENTIQISTRMNALSS